MNKYSKPLLIIEDIENPQVIYDLYVQVVENDEDANYVVDEWFNVFAKDFRGRDISNRAVYDTSLVNYTKPGDYPVEVSVMDDNLNMSVVSFTIHVLTIKEIKRIEKGYSISRKKGEKNILLSNKLFYFTLGIFIFGIIIFTYFDTF